MGRRPERARDFQSMPISMSGFHCSSPVDPHAHTVVFPPRPCPVNWAEGNSCPPTPFGEDGRGGGPRIGDVTELPNPIPIC